MRVVLYLSLPNGSIVYSKALAKCSWPSVSPSLVVISTKVCVFTTMDKERRSCALLISSMALLRILISSVKDRLHRRRVNSNS